MFYFIYVILFSSLEWLLDSFEYFVLPFPIDMVYYLVQNSYQQKITWMRSDVICNLVIISLGNIFTGLIGQ